MQIHMHDPEEWDPEKMRGFLENSQGLEFQTESRQELYGWIQATLVAQEYFHLKKKERGVIRACFRSARIAISSSGSIRL